MFDDTANPYRAAPGERGFAVLDESGRVVVVCADERSAVDYAVLLTEAYRRGYKAGYRHGRKP
jgi:hypothetical protein